MNLYQEYLIWLQDNYRGVTPEGLLVPLTLSMCEARETYEQECLTVQHQLDHNLEQTAKAIMNLAKFKFDLQLKRHGLIRLVKV